MLTVENTVLVIIDVQERLFRVMHEKEKLMDNLCKLVAGARVLGLPFVITEQYPQGLGKTMPEIVELLPDVAAVEKLHFSCCGEAAVRATRRLQQRRDRRPR